MEWDALSKRFKCHRNPRLESSILAQARKMGKRDPSREFPSKARAGLGRESPLLEHVSLSRRQLRMQPGPWLLKSAGRM